MWKKVVTFLQSHALSELGFCNFFFLIIVVFFLWQKMGVSNDNDEAKYKYSTIARETAEKYKYPNFAMETALNTSIRLQWKLRSGIQVSKSVQRKLHSGMCTITQG